MYTFTISTSHPKRWKYYAERFGATSTREEDERLIVCFTERPPLEFDDWLRSLMWNHHIREYGMQYEPEQGA